MSHLWWLWIESMEDCQRTYQEETLNQVNHIGENQTHHLRTILELQRQAMYSLPVWPDPPNDEATHQDQMYLKGMDSLGWGHEGSCCCGSCQSQQG